MRIEYYRTIFNLTQIKTFRNVQNVSGSLQLKAKPLTSFKHTPKDGYIRTPQLSSRISLMDYYVQISLRTYSFMKYQIISKYIFQTLVQINIILVHLNTDLLIMQINIIFLFFVFYSSREFSLFQTRSIRTISIVDQSDNLHIYI